MDKLTDILSTFFVNDKNKKTIVKKQMLSHRTSSAKSSSTSTSDVSSQSSSQSSSQFSSSSSDLSDSLDKNKKGTSPSRYALKASEYYKKSIILVNDDKKENYRVLGDLLHNLTIMKGADELYNNTVFIVSEPTNKKQYNKMILENPYLYFTDFEVKGNITKDQLANIKHSDKKSVLIIDEEFLRKVESELLQHENVHLFVIANSYSASLAEVYNTLRNAKSVLMIHRKEKINSLEEKFYTNIITHVTQNCTSFSEYITFMNIEDLGVRNIIIHNGDLRYN